MSQCPAAPHQGLGSNTKRSNFEHSDSPFNYNPNFVALSQKIQQPQNYLSSLETAPKMEGTCLRGAITVKVNDSNLLEINAEDTSAAA
jgi:hypothetical protein